jgi:hypothetical protein
MLAIVGLASVLIHVFIVAAGRDIGHTLSCVSFVRPRGPPRGRLPLGLLTVPPTGGLKDRLLFRS